MEAELQNLFAEAAVAWRALIPARRRLERTTERLASAARECVAAGAAGRPTGPLVRKVLAARATLVATLCQHDQRLGTAGRLLDRAHTQATDLLAPLEALELYRQHAEAIVAAVGLLQDVPTGGAANMLEPSPN